MLNPTSDQPSKSKKRRRPAKSCEQCRERKVRCDLDEPCGPCVRARASLRCTYSPKTVRSRNCAVGVERNRHKVPDPEASGPVRENERQRSSTGGDESLSHYRTPASTANQSEQDVVEPQSHQSRYNDTIVAPTSTSHLSRNPPYPASSLHSSSVTDRNLPPARPTLLQEDSVPNCKKYHSSLSVTTPSPLLRLKHDKIRIFNHTHWSHTASKFLVLAQLNHKGADLLPEHEKAELRKGGDALRRMREVIKDRQKVALNHPLSNLADTFPTKSLCDELVGAYMRTFEPMYRILHIPSFQRQYANFFDDPESSSNAFQMTLALVLAIGTTFFPIGGDCECLQRAAQAYIYAAQWLLTGPSEKSANDLEGVQVTCLLLLARQFTGLGISNSLSSDIALRLTMSIGLHHDPDHFSALSVFQVQMRRRLWYTALELTATALFNLSMPLTVSTDHYDTKPPLNLDDEDFTPETTTLLERRPDDQVSDGSLQRLMLESLPLRLRVAATLNGVGQGLDYDLVIKYGDELKTACRETAIFTHALENHRPDRILQYLPFNAQFLDMHFRRYILLLHRPFVLQAPTDPRFYFSRKTCMESAMVIASYAWKLNLPSKPSHDLARLFMNTKGPASGPLSLDVITILGFELLIQLEEEAACPTTTVNAANELAKANRAPVFRVLEHIQEQLLQIIAHGSPSMKRYGYLTAILAQLHAMDNRDENVLRTVIAAVKESMRQKIPLLESTIARSNARESVENLMRQSTSTNPMSTNTDFDDFVGQDFDLDFSDLFHFPEMTSGGMMEW